MNAALTEAPILELEDSWEAINDWFLQNDLTDGVPIVPPTEARVATMTDYVERELGFKANDVIGTLAPKNGLATVERIAANAVIRNSISMRCRRQPTTPRRCPSSTARCARPSI
jgi:hypothetical protein